MREFRRAAEAAYARLCRKKKKITRAQPFWLKEECAVRHALVQYKYTGETKRKKATETN